MTTVTREEDEVGAEEEGEIEGNCKERQASEEEQ